MLETIANIARISFGVSLIVLAFLEVVTTTISVSGVQGPITSRITDLLWRGLRWLSDRPRMQRVLLASGPIMVVTTFMLWVALTIAGWGLLFSAEGAVEARGDVRLTPGDPFFYAAGQIFGQGGPDVRTSTAGWKIAEQLLALNGVGLLSLGLAWIIPVVSAVVRKRQLATRMHLLGDTPSDVVRRARDGADLGDLHLYLNAIATDLSDLSHRQFAFPVVQYFFTTDLRAAIQPRLAILTEATFLIAAADDADDLVHPSVLNRYWRAVEDYLDRMTTRFAIPADEPPAAARTGGQPLVDDPDRLRDIHDEHRHIRCMLTGAMAFDGWRWDQTVHRDDGHDEDEVSREERTA